MKVVLIASLLALCSCTAQGFGSMPSASSDPVRLVVERLTQQGAVVRIAESIAGDPLSARATTLCVNDQGIQVFVYERNDDRDQAIGSIDPEDPSHVGMSIVEWIGSPRFWTADRAVVLYTGNDDDTEALLRSVFGGPFASGRGMLPDAHDQACD